MSVILETNPSAAEFYCFRSPQLRKAIEREATSRANG